MLTDFKIQRIIRRDDGNVEVCVCFFEGSMQIVTLHSGSHYGEKVSQYVRSKIIKTRIDIMARETTENDIISRYKTELLGDTSRTAIAAQK